MKSFEEANKVVHKVEKEYCHPFLTEAGFVTKDLTGVGFVRSYLYENASGHKIRWTVGVNSTYWRDETNGAWGYWADLKPHLDKLKEKTNAE